MMDLKYEGNDTKTNVEIINIRRGKGGREGLIYAELVEVGSGVLLIAATLDYIVKSLNAGNYLKWDRRDGYGRECF